jgi:hypothetical protein
LFEHDLIGKPVPTFPDLAFLTHDIFAKTGSHFSKIMLARPAPLNRINRFFGSQGLACGKAAV